MTQLHQHLLQQRAHELGDRLRAVLSNAENPDARRLTERMVIHPTAKPRLVLTGQYSSGKSSLIRALTDFQAEVVIDSGPATDKVEEYDWDGLVSLTDTPGVSAGIVEHDQRAEAALTSGDLVLFVVTVDLFDDAGAEHLRHVLFDLGKLDQTLVVINKHLSIEPPPDGVRAAALSQAVGDPELTPLFVECDAKEYLDARDVSDADQVEDMRIDSRIDELRRAINDLARGKGQLAQFRQPFQLIRALVDEASALAADGADELAALQVLARQRSALTARRDRIDANFLSLQIGFGRKVQTWAESFAQAVEDLDEAPAPGRDTGLPALQETLRERLAAEYRSFREAVVAMLEQQLSDLASEALQIEQGPAAQRLLRAADQPLPPAHEAEFVDVMDPGSGPGRGVRLENIHGWLQQARELNEKFVDFWGAGEGVKAAAGGTGHKIVLDVGHLLDKKFQPWEAARLANNIGRVARLVGPAIQVSMSALEVAAQERAAVEAERRRFRRRQELIAEVRRQADDLASQLRASISDSVDDPFRQSIAEIDAAVREIHDLQAARSAAAAELGAIRDAADEALSLT